MSSQTQLCSMLSVAALLFLGWGWSIGGQVPNGPTGVGSEAMLPLRATPDTSAQQPDVSSRTEQHSTLPSSTEAPALRAVVEDASERCPHGRRLLAEGPRGASTATLDASGSSPYFSAVSSGQNTGGDDKNAALGAYSVVCGGYGNTASGDYSTVGGGDGNTASKWYSTVGGGWHNTASGYTSTVGGGWHNTASGYTSTVGRGEENTASGGWSTVGGGRSNTASGDYYSTVGGGRSNTASGYASTVGGGWLNHASDSLSAIPGRYNLKVGKRSFGFSGQTSDEQTDLSAYSNIAAFVDVDLWLYNVCDLASQLRFYEPSGAGTNYTAFRAQGQQRDIVYTLPAALGQAGDVLRIASVRQDTAVLEWASATGAVPSSLRYKDEVRSIGEAPGKVLRLRGVEFRWKPEYGGGEDIGFIVEEVAPVVPQVVDRDPQTGEPVGMDYGRLTALLVEAIKEQQRELEQQRSEIEQQRRELEQLRLLVEQLLRERGNRGGEMGNQTR